jgi:hypothetical protein
VVAVLGAAALLLVLVTWAASIGPDRVVSGGHIEPIQAESPTDTRSVDNSTEQQIEEERTKKRGEPPDWLAAVAFVVELLTIGVALFLVGRLLQKLRRWWLLRPPRRRRRPPEDVEFEVLDSVGQVTEAMSEDAEEQRSLLAIGGEPRNAIVECWHRFEEQAVRAGVDRRPWQTTAEFVLGVLDLVGADRGAVARLADLYREARFSDHPMTDEHRGQALDALDVIHASLRTRTVV